MLGNMLIHPQYHHSLDEYAMVVARKNLLSIIDGIGW